MASADRPSCARAHCRSESMPVSAFYRFLTNRPGNLMYKLVLIRHGESTWNKENRFTGWVDVDLTEQGNREAQQAGVLLKEAGYTLRHRLHVGAQARDPHAVARAGPDGSMYLPVVHSWRLNERHYGALSGLNKAETADEIRRRASAGLAPQLRHAAARARSVRRTHVVQRSALREGAARTVAAHRVPEGHGRARAADLERVHRAGHQVGQARA